MTMTRARACLALFLIALAVRLMLLFGLHRYETGRTETIRTAISVGLRGAFADPYAIPTGATAHSAPLYPLAIAPIYSLLGDTPAADKVRFAVNALAASIEYALIPILAAALGLGFRPGVFAGLVGALLPLHYWPECVNEGEYAWTAIFLQLTVLLYARFLEKPSLDIPRAGGAGCLCGFGLLQAPTLAPALAGLNLLSLWRFRSDTKRMLRWIAVFSIAVCAVLAPWVVRNRVRLGGWFFVRDNLGLELFISNQDGASPTFEENIRNPKIFSQHPHVNPVVAAELRRIGEQEFERRRLQQGLQWISAHPREFASLTVRRVVRFWFPEVPRFRWAFWGVTLLAGAGWLLLWVRRRPAAVLLGTVLLLYSATYAPFQTTLRYQHPIWWILLLLAAWISYTLCARAEAPVR